MTPEERAEVQRYRRLADRVAVGIILGVVVAVTVLVRLGVYR